MVRIDFNVYQILDRFAYLGILSEESHSGYFQSHSRFPPWHVATKQTLWDVHLRQLAQRQYLSVALEIKTNCYSVQFQVGSCKLASIFLQLLFLTDFACFCCHFVLLHSNFACFWLSLLSLSTNSRMKIIFVFFAYIFLEYGEFCVCSGCSKYYCQVKEQFHILSIMTMIDGTIVRRK